MDGTLHRSFLTESSNERTVHLSDGPDVKNKLGSGSDVISGSWIIQENLERICFCVFKLYSVVSKVLVDLVWGVDVEFVGDSEVLSLCLRITYFWETSLKVFTFALETIGDFTGVRDIESQTSGLNEGKHVGYSEHESVGIF